MVAMLDTPIMQDDVVIQGTPDSDLRKDWRGEDERTTTQILDQQALTEELTSPDSVMSLTASEEVLFSTSEIEDVIKAIVEEFKYKEVTFEAANRVYLLLKLYYLFPYLKDIAANPNKIELIFKRLDEIFLNLLIQTKLVSTKSLPKGMVQSEVPAYIAGYGANILMDDMFNLKYFATKIALSLKVDTDKLAFNKPPFFFGSLDSLQLRSLSRYIQSLNILGIEKQITGTQIRVDNPSQEVVSTSYTHKDKIFVINEIAAILTHSKDEVLAGFGNALLESISQYESSGGEQ